ncbi:Ig-like domain-containing protein, partial [bacterium]|nr:Ig-like domain-containing protein [bacterium]
ADSDSFFALESHPQILQGVLSNDSDPDDDRISLFDFTLPANGIVERVGETDFRYTSNIGFSGTDSFSYRITDGENFSEPAFVTIVVSPLDGFRWINPEGGNWSEASNWSQGVVPGTEDNAMIDLSGDYLVELDSDASVARLIVGGGEGQQTVLLKSRTLTIQVLASMGENASFQMTGGTLNGDGNVVVDGELLWSGGTLRGSGETRVNSGGTLILEGRRKELQRRLVTAGQCEWSSGNIRFSNGTFVNAVGGEMDVTLSGNLEWNGGENRFINEGVIRKVGEGQLEANASVGFDNRGEIDVQLGSLVLSGGGTSSGEYLLNEADNARLRQEESNRREQRARTAIRARDCE